MNAESQQLINLLPFGYMITNGDGLITYANPFILDILQFEGDTVTNEKYFHNFLPYGVKVYFETHLKPVLLKTGKLDTVGLEILRNDGSLVSMHVNAHCLNSDYDGVKYFHYTFFDVTQNKRSESDLLFATHKQDHLIEELKLSNDNYVLITQELEENKNYYKIQSEIFEQVSEIGRVGGWELNLKNGELNWSSVTKQIFEVDVSTQPNLTEGINFLKEVHIKNIIKIVRETIKTGKPFDEELQIITAKGNETWVRALGFAERTTNSVQLHPNHMHLKSKNALQTIRIYGTFQDIDKQKNLMLQLQQSNISIAKDNAYLKSIVENNSFYIVKIDLTGAYTYFNPYFLEMLGIESKDWIGKNSMGLIVTEDHQVCMDVVDKCFREPHNTHWAILRKHSKNVVVTNQWEFSLLKDENGNFSEFLCIGHEVTTLINKQEELKKLLNITSLQNDRLQNFTHIISHNIRSHIANLKGIISITDLEKVDDRKMAWELIENTVSSLDETIHHLSEIIDMQSQKQLPMVDINIFTEINNVAKCIYVLIETSKTQIFYDFDHTASLVTNTVYFESIFLNLIINSIKYKSIDKSPKIHISMFTKDKYKVICVRDNGLGIDLKRHGDKLFGMYNTFHRNKDAKGLGLFIVKTQIEALGGKIEVESVEGEGTTFSIYFLEK